MGKTMSVVSLFKFILFFALVKMFYSLLDYIKKNRAIEKSVYRIYSTADERYEKRKEQKEKIYFEEGNVENTSFFYRLDLLIERSEIRKKIPFLSTEIYLLFLGIISVIAFVIGNLIFGLIGAVLGITLSILIIHSSLYILARLNYERVDNEITKFVNLVESYSVSSNDILSVMGNVYPYLNDPLRTYIETFYNEVSTTGDYDRAFMNLKNKAESERLKEALLILNGKLIRDKDIELAIQDFNDKFDNPHIDSLCAIIKSGLESGKTLKILEDVTEQLEDISEAGFRKEENEIERQVTYLQLMVYVGVIATSFFIFYLELINSVSKF